MADRGDALRPDQDPERPPAGGDETRPRRSPQLWMLVAVVLVILAGLLAWWLGRGNDTPAMLPGWL